MPDISRFLEACREHNDIEVEAHLYGLRLELEWWQRHGDERVVH